MRSDNTQFNDGAIAAPWPDFMGRFEVGQGPENQATNTSTREVPDDGDRGIALPGQTFDAALEEFRVSTGHALHAPPPLAARSPIPPVRDPSADEPAPRMPVVPEPSLGSELSIPAAMVPDAAIRLGRLIGWLGGAVEAWRQHRILQSLRLLDDHLLCDVGLTRKDLQGGERSRDALRRLKAQSEL